ncbi:TolC family protein [Solimonas sp. K1W22B-7]|uniref:efflux transporter outer membrane subunit n=1 Tax=Solimonas sp. K1W22B-7 TaxID=2303331 RepID=UPI000E3317EF|nr:TolC family protein [Solimonas sp. K1W22B-7]AXQ31595.1 TolC family protein [Solimonas sp. K1W22B-7]
MKLLLPMLAAIALVGCAVGPDYRAPDTKPAAFANADAGVVVADAYEARWWKLFGDEQLATLVEQALAANHDIGIAVARVSQARALFRDQRLDQFPVVTANAAGTFGREPLVTASSPGYTGPRTEVENARVGFDAAWELDLFGRVRRGVEAARAEAEGAEAGLREAQVLVAAEVARHYFEWRGAGEQIDVARRNRDTQAETLRLTDVRLRLGRGTELEVVSARARLEVTEATIADLELAQKRSEHRLAVLLGQRPGAWTPPAVADAPAIARALPVGGAEDLLRRRPDIARAAAQLHAATARIGLAKADYFPRLSVTGFAGIVTGSFGDLGEAAHRAWTVTPQVSWAAFDMGSIAARVDAADANTRAAAAAYEQAVLVALEEVENAFVGVSRSRQRLEHTLAQAGAARRAAELARIQYRAGSTDFLVLLDAERTLLAAEDGVARAETAVNTSTVQMYKALSGGWNEVGVVAAR